MAHPHAELRARDEAHAHAHVRKAGYAAGGDVAQDKKMIARAFREHDEQLHGGKKTHLRLKSGGKVGGAHAKPRADKMARGGKVGKGRGNVNIVISTGGGAPERQQAFQQGAQVGATVGKMAGALAPRPPVGAPPMPPPGMAPPPSAAAARPPMMSAGMSGPPMPPMAKGGRVKMRDSWAEKHGGGESSEKEYREVQRQTQRVREREGGLARGGKVYPLDNAGGGGAAGRAQKANAMPGVNGKIKVRAHERRRGGSC